MQKNDFANAILVLNRGLELEPQNIPIAEETPTQLLFSERQWKSP